jgi:hypothetical protein
LIGANEIPIILIFSLLPRVGTSADSHGYEKEREYAIFVGANAGIVDGATVARRRAFSVVCGT